MPGWHVHVALGASVGVAVAGVTGDPLAIPIAAVAGLAPDIDHPQSYISHKLIPLPGFLRPKEDWGPGVRHRGAWHHPLAALSASLIAGIVCFHFLVPMAIVAWTAGVATGLGWTSHIAADYVVSKFFPHHGGPRRRRRRARAFPR